MGTSSSAPVASVTFLMAMGVHSTPFAAMVAYTFAMVSGAADTVPPMISGA